MCFVRRSSPYSGSLGRSPSRSSTPGKIGGRTVREPLIEVIRYPRVQVLTVAELLEGRGIDRPFPGERDITIKRAPRAQRAKQKTGRLPLEE